MNGAAAHWLILTKNQAARANSVRLDLALILLPGSSTSGPGVLGTLPCSEQVTVETDHPQILNYQTFRLYSQKFQDTTVYPTNQIMLSAIHHTDETSQNR